MNYKKLGFKCGLEIHGQLDTGKLFCRCPSVVRGNNRDYIMKRQIRAAKGETGEIDIAARHEMEKHKVFSYTGDRDITCLVEFDEEPPRKINSSAVEVALQVAKLCKCDFVDQIHVMRKTVVDGSNVSGFQRTMLVAMDGHIKTSKGKVAIDSLCLEEESAQKIRTTRSEVEYSLDRLGIPLLEIATDASIKDAEHAKECAEIIGMIIKSTGKMRRGIGSIRQDVNVSIEGHPRVEIKGFQDLKGMPLTIEKEVERQLRDIKMGKDLRQMVRNAKPDGTSVFLRPMPGAARMYPETDVETIVPDVKGIKVPKLISEKQKEIEKLGLSKDLAQLIAKEGKSELFMDFVNEFPKVKPGFIAETMLPTLKELEREGLDIKRIDNAQTFDNVFRSLNDGEISKDSVIPILREIGKGKDLYETINSNKSIDDSEIKKVVKQVLEENKGAPFGALMGKAMEKLRGKADGKKISEMIKKLI